MFRCKISILKVVCLFLLGVGVWFSPKNVNDFQWEKGFISSASADVASDVYNGTVEQLQCLYDKGLIGAAGFGLKNGFKGIINAGKALVNLFKDEANKLDYSEIEAACPEDGKTTFERIYNSFTGIADGCWFCPIFNTLFETINSLATKMNDPSASDSLAKLIAGGPTSLLWVLLYGYIIFVVGKAFLTSTFKEISGTELVSEVFMPFLRCIIAALLIFNWHSIYTYAINPLVVGSIGFGQSIQEQGGAEGRVVKVTISGGKSEKKCDNLTYSATPTSKNMNLRFNKRRAGSSVEIYTLPDAKQAFSEDVGKAIQCFLMNVSQNLIVWMSVGATFLADCWGLGFMHILPHWTMLFVGLIVFLGAFLIFISFPIKLLDTLFRLMFVSALMPLWIAFWVIPQTRQYTKKAWEMLVNVLVTFVILSVILVMLYQIIASIFNKNVSGIDLQTMITLLGEDKSKQAAEKIDFSGVGLFLSAALMYLAFSLLGKAETFVGQFASGGGIGIGSDVSKHVTKGTQLVGKVGAAAAGAVGRSGLNTIRSRVINPLKNYGASIAGAYRAGEAEGSSNPDTGSLASRAGRKWGELRKEFKGGSGTESSGSTGSGGAGGGSGGSGSGGSGGSGTGGPGGGSGGSGGGSGGTGASGGSTSTSSSNPTNPTRSAPTVIKGEKGDAGDKGDKGDAGVDGKQGEKGEKAEDTKAAESLVRKESASSGEQNNEQRTNVAPQNRTTSQQDNVVSQEVGDHNTPVNPTQTRTPVQQNGEGILNNEQPSSSNNRRYFNPTQKKE